MSRSLSERILANRQKAENPVPQPVPRVATMRTASLRTACAGDDTCPKCGGVRHPEPAAAAASTDDVPPPPTTDVLVAKIRRNRERQHETRDQQVHRVRTVLGYGQPRPLANDADNAASMRSMTDDDRIPPPPSLTDKILKNRGER